MNFHRSLRPMFFKTAILFLAALFGASRGGHFRAVNEARASSVLSVQVRVQQEFYEPLIPLSKNFKTCFKTDANGAQVMGICTDGGPAQLVAEPVLKSARLPASQSPPSAPAPRAQQKSQAPQRAAPAAPSAGNPSK